MKSQKIFHIGDLVYKIKISVFVGYETAPEMFGDVPSATVARTWINREEGIIAIRYGPRTTFGVIFHELFHAIRHGLFTKGIEHKTIDDGFEECFAYLFEFFCNEFKKEGIIDKITSKKLAKR